VIALLLLCLLALPGLAQPTLSVMGNPRQGDPLFVSVKGVAPGTKGVLRFANLKWELSPAGEDAIMRTVVAVPVDLAAGPHPMIAELSDQARVERTVTTSRRGWPSQSIWLPESTMAGYDDPQNKADDEAILEALKPLEPERLWKGNWSIPISAPQGTGFGEKRVYNGGVKRSYHKGLDLSGWEGMQVHAPASGVVLHTASGVVNGNTIVLGHGLGLGTVYFHLSSIDVEVGEQVTKGQVIGRVGGTGGFAPHLHWEVRAHGVPVEPHALLQLPASWR
jgi:murein DD-endopeptidase MepM/ murein hydrolase activator NlpD